MGRNEIEIRYIDLASTRQNTFKKRYSGLIKKAHELSVLTGCQCGVVLFNEDKLYTFSTTEDITPLLNRYKTVSSEERYRRHQECKKDLQDALDKSFQAKQSKKKSKNLTQQEPRRANHSQPSEAAESSGRMHQRNVYPGQGLDLSSAAGSGHFPFPSASTSAYIPNHSQDVMHPQQPYPYPASQRPSNPMRMNDASVADQHNRIYQQMSQPNMDYNSSQPIPDYSFGNGNYNIGGTQNGYRVPPIPQMKSEDRCPLDTEVSQVVDYNGNEDYEITFEGHDGWQQDRNKDDQVGQEPSYWNPSNSAWS